MALLLFTQSILLPLEALAEELPEQNDSEDMETVELFSDIEQEIPIFEEDDKLGEILTYLANGDEVTIIDADEDFSLVEFIQTIDDDSVALKGYVENHFLLNQNDHNRENDDSKTKNKEEPIKEKDIKDEVSDEVEDPVSKDDNIIVEDDRTENDSHHKQQNDTEEASEIEDKETKSNISTFSQANYQGLAQKSTTYIRTEPSTKSKPLTTFPIGTILTFQDYSNHWYSITVNIGGKAQTGYIHKKHIEKYSNSNQFIRGVAKKSPTNIRTEPSTKSAVLTKYSIGSILKLKPYSTHWYEATVTENGIDRIGYIHKKHVEITETEQQTLKGIALKSPTNIRSRASTKGSILTRFPIGSIIEINTFSEYWYEITITNNGENQTGYIHKKHVEKYTNSGGEYLRGVTKKSPTNIRTEPSTKTAVLTKYSIGSIIKLKPYSTYWYEVTVSENGINRIGYIHKKHVEVTENEQYEFNGLTLKSPTNVRAKASTKSKVLEKLPIDSIIRLNTFSSYWYEVELTINGNKTVGYIHKKHVEDAEDKIFKGIAGKDKTNIRTEPSTKSTILKTVPIGTILEYSLYNDYWYKTIVIVNGQKKTGYIHKYHLEESIINQKNTWGLTLRSPTNIRSLASTKSDVLTTFPIDSIIELRTFSDFWYEVTVETKGNEVTGYVHKKHVENIGAKVFKGVALKEKTYIRSTPSTTADPLISVPIGTIIEYNLYNEYWYKALVEVNGKQKTGYIHKYHIEEAEMNQINEQGIALKSPTRIRTRASTKSDTLTTFPFGSKITYKTFSSYWHEVVVTINGKQKTGYIHKKHIGEKAEFHHALEYNFDFEKIVNRQMGREPAADGAGKIRASRGQVEFYLNPFNFPKNTNEYYQFLVLSSPAGLNANEVNNKILKGKGVLEGTAQYFINAGNTYNINEAYLIAHALHETGNGNSTLAKGIFVDAQGNVTRDAKGNIAKTSKTKHTVYNMFGYGAYDSCPIDCGAKYAFNQGWFSVESSIVGGIGSIKSYINRGQDTLYKMRWNPDGDLGTIPEVYQYATHVQWATLQTKRIADIYSLLTDYTITFEIPKYNNVPEFGSTTADLLNFRSGPSTNYTVIGSIPRNSKVQIIGSNVNGWYQIKYNSKIGWVSAEYVNLTY